VHLAAIHRGGQLKTIPLRGAFADAEFKVSCAWFLTAEIKQLMRPKRTIVALAGVLLAAGYCAVLSHFDYSAHSQPSPLAILPVDAAPDQTQSVTSNTDVYPLKPSTNKRYLVDQRNRPFLMIGDAPQTIVANLSVAEAATYMANRREYGINTLWINLLCNFSDGCNKDATTFDGVAPFLAAGELSGPNPVYFQRADDMIELAATHGMVVLLDPIETSSWLPVLRAAGIEQAFRYGQYLGRRYKNFPNIIWMHGNDFQSWRNRADDALVQAVAQGIRSEDQNHIHTVELNFMTSGSLDDSSWAPLVDLDAASSRFLARALSRARPSTRLSLSEASFLKRDSLQPNVIVLLGEIDLRICLSVTHEA
jgi:hypothetical protein